MLNRLRWQLTMLYALGALVLILLIGAGSYFLLQYYFLSETDLALEYKMASEFQAYGLSLPGDLAASQQAWMTGNRTLPLVARSSSPTPPARSRPTELREEEEEREGESSDHTEGEDWEHNEAFDGSLSAVFVLPESGQDRAANLPIVPILQDPAAAQQALLTGSDIRTVALSNGSRVRLLSYRTQSPGAPEVLQVGRLLDDQDRVLSLFNTGLFILGSVGVVVLGLASWWLAGRTIDPAQRAWEQQQVFIANASHELRTPLTLIRASTEYALRKPGSPDQGELLQTVLQDVDYMNRLVEDLLLLSRLDARRLQLEKSAISLPALLEDLAGQFGRLAAEKGVELSIPQPQGAVLGDPTRLRQVILVLLDNALRHTPEGGRISITTRSLSKQVEIIVSDTGRGIPAAAIPHIFDRFYQASQPGEEGARSNGLGLSIARGLIDAMGGSITLESQVGVGTRVTIRMPSANAA